MKKRLKIIGVLVLALAVITTAVVYWVVFRRSPGAYFEHAGIRLFYSDTVGDMAADGDEREAVILLHGFAVNGDLNWRLTGVAKALREDYRVIVLDQRGHGLSSKPHEPEAYGAEMAEDVVRLMDYLNIDRAHVAGYSLGGYVALKLAALHPERLLSVGVLGAGWQDPEAEKGEATFIALDRLAAQLESGRAVEPVATTFSEGEHRTTAWHRLQVRLATRLLGDKQALAAMLRGVRGLALTRGEVSAITVPILVVCGDIDPNYTSAVNLHEVLPACTFVPVPGRSHPGTAMSNELREALRAFLGAHP